MRVWPTRGNVHQMKNAAPKRKWSFAIGTTSLVPKHKSLHYLMADVDSNYCFSTLGYFSELGVKNFTLQRTPHGWHIYTDTKMPWRKLTSTLSRTPGVDQSWLHIGIQRGYLFLADKSPGVPLYWSVKRMVLHHEKSKAVKARATGAFPVPG